MAQLMKAVGLTPGGFYVAPERVPARRPFTQDGSALLAVITKRRRGPPADQRRRAAPATFGTMAGAAILARAVDDANTPEGIVEAGRGRVLAG